MAEKNRRSQAERAVSAAKSKRKKNTADKKNSQPKVTANSPAKPKEIPVRLISSITCLALFVLFLVVFLLPEGELVPLLNDLLHGLIGRAGLVVCIPVLLYLFFIHAFSGKRPIRMRTVCLLVFVLLCGCITHLILDPKGQPDGIGLLGELFTGGIDGTTGGLLCGGIAMLIKWLCGPVISYVVLIIAGILTLLAGMQITVPSIIRAIKNRPRPEWENEEAEERQEPATIVVNQVGS